MISCGLVLHSSMLLPLCTILTSTLSSTDRSFNDTISFDELQEMAKRCNEVLEDNEREEICWLGRLGRYDYMVERSRSNLLSHDSPASVTEATWVDGQIVVQQQESANTRTRKREVASETFSQHDSADFVISQ